jgi:hypothetical protein
MADELYDLNSIEVLNFNINWKDNINIKYGLQRTITNFASTGSDVLLFSNLHSHEISFSLLIDSKEDIYSLLETFRNKQGMLKKFWAYGYKDELQLAIDKVVGVSEYLYIENNGLNLNFHGHERFYIKLNNGDVLTRRIRAIEEYSGNTLKITITPIAREIKKTDICEFGRIFLCRFAKDVIELNYLTENIIETKIELVEVLKEYAN